MDALQALVSRVSIGQLTDPAPSGEGLEAMLASALSAPDHGRLRPWRFVLIKGDARRKLGEVMADALRQRDPATPAAVIDREKEKPMRAPLIVVVAATTRPDPKIPEIEQIVSAGAAAQNILLAAHALGFGGMWRTGGPAYDPAIKAALGLAVSDTIVGFLYLGTPVRAALPRKPQAQDGLVTTWE